jgi:hypothetical protein
MHFFETLQVTGCILGIPIIYSFNSFNLAMNQEYILATYAGKAYTYR